MIDNSDSNRSASESEISLTEVETFWIFFVAAKRCRAVLSVRGSRKPCTVAGKAWILRDSSGVSWGRMRMSSDNRMKSFSSSCRCL